MPRPAHQRRERRGHRAEPPVERSLQAEASVEIDATAAITTTCPATIVRNFTSLTPFCRGEIGRPLGEVPERYQFSIRNERREYRSTRRVGTNENIEQWIGNTQLDGAAASWSH